MEPGWYFFGDPADNATIWGTKRVWLPLPVTWGGETTLIFTVRASTRVGYATLRYRMVEETATWFGATLSRSVRVVR